MQEEKNEITIDLRSIFSLILKRWWTILICLVVGGAIGFGVARITYQPTYRTRAAYLLTYNSGGDTVGSLTQDNNFIRNIMGNCITIVQQPTFTRVLETKVNEGVLQGSSGYIGSGRLSGAISYSYNTNSSTVISITVNTDNRDDSYRIVNAIVSDDFFATYIKDVYRFENSDSLTFNLIENPVDVEPTLVSESSTLRNTLIGGIGLAFVCVVFWAIVAVVDTRIKGVEDLTDKYNIPVLGSIPDLEDKNLNKGGYHHGYQKEE